VPQGGGHVHRGDLGVREELGPRVAAPVGPPRPTRLPPVGPQPRRGEGFPPAGQEDGAPPLIRGAQALEEFNRLGTEGDDPRLPGAWPRGILIFYNPPP